MGVGAGLSAASPGAAAAQHWELGAARKDLPTATEEHGPGTPRCRPGPQDGESTLLVLSTPGRRRDLSRRPKVCRLRSCRRVAAREAAQLTHSTGPQWWRRLVGFSQRDLKLSRGDKIAENTRKRGR